MLTSPLLPTPTEDSSYNPYSDFSSPALKYLSAMLDPPPTDGPNTRARLSRGLPPVSGSTLPLPQHGYPTPEEWSKGGDDWRESREVVKGGNVNANGVGGEWNQPPVENDTQYSYPSDYELQTPSTASAPYYPIYDPSLPDPSSYSQYPYDTTITYYSYPSQPETSYTTSQPQTPYTPSQYHRGDRLVSTTETIIDHGSFEEEEEVWEEPDAPAKGVTKDEWLKLGGFEDSPPQSTGVKREIRDLPNPSTQSQSPPQLQYHQPPPPPQQFDFTPSTYPYPTYPTYYPPPHPSPSPLPPLPSPSTLASLPPIPTPQIFNSKKKKTPRSAPSPTAKRPRQTPYPTQAPLPPPLQSPPTFSLHPLPPPSSSTLLPPQIPAALRKSHSRKKSASHIPRPRNAFILFRSHAVRTRMIPVDLGITDHKNISKIIGELWRGLGGEERGVWEELAEEEKRRHAGLWPGYKYKPKQRVKEGKEGKKDEVVEMESEGVASPSKKRRVRVEREHLRVDEEEEEEEDVQDEDEDFSPPARATRSSRSRQSSPAKRSTSPPKGSSTTPAPNPQPSTPKSNAANKVDWTRERCAEVALGLLQGEEGDVLKRRLEAVGNNEDSLQPPPPPPSPTSRQLPTSPISPTSSSTNSSPAISPGFKHSRLARRSSAGTNNSSPSSNSPLGRSLTSRMTMSEDVASSNILKVDKRSTYASLGNASSTPPPTGPWFAPSQQLSYSSMTNPSTTSNRVFSPTKFDNSPLLSTGTRKFSLGRWELRKASKAGMSEREVRANSHEEIQEEGEGVLSNFGQKEFFGWGEGQDGFHCGSLGLFETPPEVFGRADEEQTGLGIEFGNGGGVERVREGEFCG